MEHQVTVRETCRVCGSGNLTPLFSLGEQFVSDFVKREDVYAGIKCPLELEMCGDCALVQLKHTAPQELLYKRHYWYRSGVTETMRHALRIVVDVASEIVELIDGDVVLDIGSNDGTLLNFYHHNLVRVGCEPAENLNSAENYEAKGSQCIRDFWSESAYGAWSEEHTEVDGDPSSEGQDTLKAKIITAIGMFYDCEDPNQFIADVAKVLHPDGVFVAQLMCLKNMLSACDVGNICHEHLEYYTLESLERLLSKHGLEIVDISTVPVNGESYRLTIKHKVPHLRVHDRVGRAFVAERHIRTELADFFRQMESNKRAVVQFIRDAAACGKKVWVYGASTKGNTILQYYGLDSTLIAGAADRSPEKHGLYTAGTSIPIYSEEYARARNPDYFLVLPYAFLDEFVEREAAWHSRGGRFIVPLPGLRVV